MSKYDEDALRRGLAPVTSGVQSVLKERERWKMRMMELNPQGVVSLSLLYLS